MGRRSGGGRASSVIPQNILQRRLESCKQKYSTVDEMVDYLRTNYPDYRRTKLQPFTRLVRQALQQHSSSSKSTPNIFRDSEDDEEQLSQTHSRKKLKTINHIDERLQRIEDGYLKRIRTNNQDHSSTSEESEESSSSSGGAVSTSEDAIYGENVEPEFDLMKTMLRATYSPKLKEKENIEVEDVSDKKANKIDMINGERLAVNDLKNEVKGSVSNNNGEVKGNEEGPRFRDLGGMGSVLEELKMEVIVPLYHPQLPRWLGVRPMAGILLHGPPGCGKTKLAHAIANETGVPFYKISATEVVSGVSGMSVFSY